MATNGELSARQVSILNARESLATEVALAATCPAVPDLSRSEASVTESTLATDDDRSEHSVNFVNRDAKSEFQAHDLRKLIELPAQAARVVPTTNQSEPIIDEIRYIGGALYSD